VSGSTVTVANHLTGDRASWRLEGEVLNVRLTDKNLLLVQADRLTLVPYRMRSADPTG